MTVYDYREITLKDDLCLEISRDTDIENPRENDCNAATFYCLKSPRRKIGDIIDSAYYLNETKRTLAKTGEYAILPIYIYEHPKRNFPGCVFLVGKHTHVMQGTSGSHNGKADGYYDTNGNSYSSGECKFVAKNEGIVFA